MTAPFLWPVVDDRTGDLPAFKRICNTRFKQLEVVLGRKQSGLGWINVKDFGATGNGLTDDTDAIRAAAVAAADGVLFFPPLSYKLAGAIELPSNVIVLAYGATLTQTTNAVVFSGHGVSHVSIYGGSYVGVGSSTTFALGSPAGLIYFYTNGSTACSDVVIRDVSITNAYCGISAIQVSRLWIEHNTIRHFKLWGVCASRSVQFFVQHNVIRDSDEAGANLSYGVMATGDEALGFIQKDGVIAYNLIDGVPAWDGVMTHDCDTLLIQGNQIRNVRHGIDIGPFATGIIRNVRVLDNEIAATTTDTWSGAGAPHAAIQATGWDATNRLLGLTIRGNICRGFNRIAGATITGNNGVIVVVHADDVLIGENTITDTGTSISTYAGVFLAGTLNRLTVVGNSLQGTHAAGGIRFINATVDAAAVSDNTVIQATTSDNAVLLSGTSIAAFTLGPNPTNSTAPFVTVTSSYTWSGYVGSAYLDVTQAIVRGTTAGVLTLDTQSGATTDDTELRFVRAGANKWRIGCNIDGANTDTFNVYNDGTTSFPLKIHPTLNRATFLTSIVSGIATLTDAATIATDASLGNAFKVTLGGNRTLGAPTNPAVGQRVTWTIIQDATGGRTLTPDAVFKWSWSDAGNTAGKRSSIAAIYDGTHWNQDGAQTPYV